jgi:SAM-dependent methyltransferase
MMNIHKRVTSMNRTGTNLCRSTATAYNVTEESYLNYAARDVSRLFELSGQYGFADREIWKRLDATLIRMAAEDNSLITLLDVGCGPGTWLRRLALRARELGFERVNATGVDTSPIMIEIAKSSAPRIDDRAIRLEYIVHDITEGSAFKNREFDLCLCLYGVLNHLPRETHRGTAYELARVTGNSLFVTVNTVGGRPENYVDFATDVAEFQRYENDDVVGVYMMDRQHLEFPSHRFSSIELLALFKDHLAGTTVVGIDMFHTRFAPDARWNPSAVAFQQDFELDLSELEYRYASDPRFINRAAHILLIGEQTGS